MSVQLNTYGTDDGVIGTLVLTIHDAGSEVDTVRFRVTGASGIASSLVAADRVSPGVFEKDVPLASDSETLIEPVVTLKAGGTLPADARSFPRLSGQQVTLVQGPRTERGSSVEIGTGLILSRSADGRRPVLGASGSSSGGSLNVQDQDTPSTVARTLAFQGSVVSVDSNGVAVLDLDGRYSTNSALQRALAGYYTRAESDGRYAPIGQTGAYLPLSGGTLTGGLDLAIGNIKLGHDGNGSVEIGDSLGNGTPFIDFHKGVGGVQDYNVRVINDTDNSLSVQFAAGSGRFIVNGAIQQNGVAVSLAGHTHSFASLTSTPTTLAGYGITDAFTQAAGDARYLALNGAVADSQLSANIPRYNAPDTFLGWLRIGGSEGGLSYLGRNGGPYWAVYNSADSLRWYSGQHFADRMTLTQAGDLAVGGSFGASGVGSMQGVSANRDSSGSSGGLYLYGGDHASYYVAMRRTAHGGTHGAVLGDWATYLAMDASAGRGWIFKAAGGNVASISNAGHATLNGQLAAQQGVIARNVEMFCGPTYTATIRSNDGNPIYLQAGSAGAVNVGEPTSVSAKLNVGGPVLIQRNTVNAQFNTGHLELQTTDSSAAALGFHRAGATAVTLRHGETNVLDLIDAGGNPATYRGAHFQATGNRFYGSDAAYVAVNNAGADFVSSTATALPVRVRAILASDNYGEAIPHSHVAHLKGHVGTYGPSGGFVAYDRAGGQGYTIYATGSSLRFHSHQYTADRAFLDQLGNLTVLGAGFMQGVSANKDNSGTSGGVYLYGGDHGSYYVAMRSVAHTGAHGAVVGDWATYFAMDSHPGRGWIFKAGAGNAASISNAGHASFNGHLSAAGGVLAGPYIQLGTGSDAAIRRTDGGHLHLQSGVAGSVAIGTPSSATNKLNVGGGVLVDGSITMGGWVDFDAGNASQTAPGAYRGVRWGSTGDTRYAIYKGPATSIDGLHAQLRLAWHTGIQIGAQSGHGGVRFYSNEGMATTGPSGVGGHPPMKIFSVGEGDNNVRVNGNQLLIFGPNAHSSYLYVGGSANNTASAASVCATDGNLHIDSKQGHAIYMNYWSNANVAIGGGVVPLTGYRLSVGGAVHCSAQIQAANFVLSSDARLKTHAAPLSGSLRALDRIGGYTYEMIAEPGTRRVGVMAQEVREVYPWAVVEQPDGMLAVDYGLLTPLLIEAVKELRAEVEVLRNG